MGVSDPEGDRLSGRAFTASTLHNILPKDANRPDLILHHGSQTIHEYNNPDLMPGMYPSLFPFGIEDLMILNVLLVFHLKSKLITILISLIAHFVITRAFYLLLLIYYKDVVLIYTLILLSASLILMKWPINSQIYPHN
jgi:hypothetical protein